MTAPDLTIVGSYARRVCILLCALLVFGCDLHVQAQSLSRLSIDEIRQREPLAECDVRPRKVQSEPATEQMSVVYTLSPLSSDPLDNYARSRTGDWQISSATDDSDPWVRLLVLTPERPVLVDLAVLADSRSFRKARENWIELLLLQAGGLHGTDEEVTEEDEPSEGTSDTSGSSDVANSAKALLDSVVEGAAEIVQDAKEKVEDIAEQAEEKAGELSESYVGVAAKRRVPPSIINRLKSYMAALGGEIDTEEVRWLLADWTGGPGLLLLGPGAAWRRADVAPLWTWLDADRDGQLDSSELRAAASRMVEADVNEDDIVQYEELLSTAKMLSPYQRKHTHPLLVLIDQDTDWDVLRSDLVEAFGEQGVATSSQQLKSLLTDSPEVTFAVQMSEDGKVKVLQSSFASSLSSQPLTSTDSVVSVDLGGLYFELSAIYQEPDKEEIRAPQIAIGAVVDGYPLLRLLDTDNDRRITRPEQRRLDQLLEDCDRDGNGMIQQSEFPTAIRLCVTNGPFVHEVLNDSSVAAFLPSVEKLELPGWFKDMDRNRDKELSRREFLGTSQQFDALDRDGNGIISGPEVQDSNGENE